MANRPLITLTTDFGLNDHFVGTIKGVILDIVPEAEIVDICHAVQAFDVLDGALTVAQAYSYFPNGTVHVVVVDPGVGTARRPILLSTGRHYFVAPDNGVLSLVYGREERLQVRHINAEHYFLNPVSTTFHGRDIFAPTAAWLSKTWQTQSFGEEVEDFVRFAIPKPKATGNTIKCVVLRVDHFGNLVTNLKPEDAPALVAPDGKFTIRVGNGMTQRMVGTFADGAAGEPVALIGSTGYVEIAVNKGNAARTLGAARGSEVTVELGG